ncbi:MAG: reverse transcriptase domain-containing protein [Sedimenticola sp.]
MLFSFENLQRHYLSCRRNKRNTHNALAFEVNQELNLLALLGELQDRSYRPGPSVCFVTRRPKLREIFAADFRDRVVHHLLVESLERYWERVFIHDSYACRKGKGIHQAVDRLQQYIRQVSANGSRRAWYLQLDIRNYFMTIDKAVLWRLLEPHIDDPDALWLTRLLVFHDCTQGHIYKGRSADLARLPPHKTLTRTAPGKGLPIGNLNSQFFANVYLNRLDQFVKHRLKCRHYLRYCDDFVLLSTNPDELATWREAIQAFLEEELLLKLNDKRERLRPVSDGIDFLGYIVRREYRLVRRRVVGNLFAKLSVFERELVGETSGRRMLRFDVEVLDRLHAVLSSYLGHLSHANSYRLWAKLWRRFGFLRWYFHYHPDDSRLERRYLMPKGMRTVGQQYRYLRWRYPEVVLLFPVGRFIEFYCQEDDALCQWLGLRKMGFNRRRARYGFPLARVDEYACRLLAAGRVVARISEAAEGTGGVRYRCLCTLIR